MPLNAIKLIIFVLYITKMQRSRHRVHVQWKQHDARSTVTKTYVASWKWGAGCWQPVLGSSSNISQVLNHFLRVFSLTSTRFTTAHNNTHMN